MKLKGLRGALFAMWLLGLLANSIPAWAVTTGRLGGQVTDSKSGAAIAGATVTANSPSQVATAQTDAGGRYVFLSLAPDSYTVSVNKSGYQPVSRPGAVVFAGSEAVVDIAIAPAIKEIARVESIPSGNLVRSGTTTDVYSVGTVTQQKAAVLGGGASLKSAYSAIAVAPGAVVPLNQTGYNQTVLIRGGDYNQVGFEFDGIPINRAFDNAPPGQLSSLGLREVQIYTGATPADSQGQGLSGYINQVIKTGTYPGSAEFELGIGTPTYFHSAQAEVAGATPDRLFSYYVGLSGYNQEFRYVDNSNAAGYTWLGQVLNYATPPSCSGWKAALYSICYANGFGPGGYINGPYNFGFQSGIASRDVVANVHIGVPHKTGGGKDDIQILYDSALLHNTFYSSTNDIGGPAFSTTTFGGLPTWTDGYSWSGPVGTTVPLNYNFAGQIGRYYFPSSVTARPVASVMPFDGRDTQWNGQNIFKLQYQKNIGGSAYVRLYGYTLFSDNLQNGPMSAFLSTGGGGGLGQTSASRDYILASHVRGLSLEFADQLGSQNLLQGTANYLYSTSTRSNNTTMLNGSGSSSRFAVLVDPKNLTNGVCYVYNPSSSGGTVPTTCTVNAPSSQRATWLSLSSPTSSVPAGTMCGPDPCAFFVAENSLHASYNDVSASFAAGSLTDQWRPNDRFLLSAGLRYDTFKFIGGNTDPSNPARQFWFNAFNHDNCVDNVTGVPIANPPTSKCPAGTSVPHLQNVSGQIFNYDELQPRISGTYTFDPNSVVRFSYGRYVEPPTSAQEQFNTWQENLAAYLGYNFYRYGFTTPGHAVRPMTSNNYDLSLEHHFKNTDWSMKLTPFYRATQDQTQSFYLDQLSGFTSYLNVGNQTSEGFELEVDKGDFSRNGLSGILSFTYTNSYIRYNTLPNGTTIVTQLNSDIVNYNSYTSFCSTHQADVRCAGGSQTGSAAPCYSTVGTPMATCTNRAVANPYWNAPVQPLLSPTANYATYDLFPGPVGGSANAFSVPYVAALILNYKHDKFAITPSFQFQGGMRYGSPESMIGIDPAAGCKRLPGSISGDPRYPYGAPGGSPYDAVSCGGTIPVPNRYTGQFDPIGAFLQPNEFLMNLQISYDVSPKITLSATLANIVNNCWGGTAQAWTYANGQICSYQVNNTFGSVPPVANVYNPHIPGNGFQPVAQFPYGAFLGPFNPAENSTKFPFNAYFQARIRI